MSSGYRPTEHIRWLQKPCYRGHEFILQQLWRSYFEGEDEEWREVEIITGEEHERSDSLPNI